ncbi:MAG: HEPN domain-containing protein [Candidatus Bathyarchaeia archaeon]
MWRSMDESEYLRWILFSRKTLNSARGDFERGDYNWACFKSHQAAELALKALLRGLGMPSYGHSLSRLLEGAGRIFGCEDNVVQAAKTLDKYYVPTRYPNAWVEGSPDEYYTRRDAEEAIKFAENIISWVEGKWGSLKKGEG